MITEHQQEMAALFAAGALSAGEEEQFAAEISANAELRELVASFQNSMAKVARTTPGPQPPARLKPMVIKRVSDLVASKEAEPSAPGPMAVIAPLLPGLHFVDSGDQSGWKELPVRGAWIKLLSYEPKRGYAVLMGKLEAGVRYPAHQNAGPEDFYILTGDLHVSDRKLGPGDFHHADAGSLHAENYSVEGCTLLAVLTADDPLVAFAMA